MNLSKLSSIRKSIRITFIVFLGVALIGIAYWNLSPVPKALLIRKAFEGGTFVPPIHYEHALNATKIVKDINYNSNFPNGTLDIIYPKNKMKQQPVIFWMHGGGFVGGDKADITGYAVELAAHGYPVVNINYALAPKNTYPTPVIQLGEAYKYLKNNNQRYQINLDQVYFAGDSAGAQISGQFIMIQTSARYAKLAKIQAIVPSSTIKGSLLFCGPYHMPALAKIEATKKIQDFLRTTGWAYIGKKNWDSSPEIQISSILNHVTKNYPPTFITDGNTGSFENQGKELAAALRRKGVFVDSLFFDKKRYGNLAHEFQFKMNTQAGLDTFNRVLAFLEKNSM